MKKLHYLVLDYETATLPFADELATGNSEAKKKIAIAKPLIYDIGWTIVDRNGNIEESKQFLVSEIFSVPAVFNTAYYKEKRPLYLQKLKSGETVLDSWINIADELENDLKKCDFCCAFNAMFDFKKAIPFTDLYINKVYSDNYYEWEQVQRIICTNIINGRPCKSKDFDDENFIFRGNDYPLADIWGMSCDRLINTQSFKKKCFENGMLTASGEYFKTSAEASYRYCLDKYDFEEAHTALEDAIIESALLAKILHKGAIKSGIDYFPFRQLGTTIDFIEKAKLANGARANYAQSVVNIMTSRIMNNVENGKDGAYTSRLMNYVDTLYKIIEGEN